MDKFKVMFDYNTDAAKFIANNGTISGKDLVKQVEPLYLPLGQTNREMGDIMKKH